MRNEDLSHTASDGLHQSNGLAAHDDYDVIPAGAHAPATGNALTGLGTISGHAGADTLGAGHALLVSIIGAGGAPGTEQGGQFEAQGRYGHIRIDAHGNYVYTRDAGSPNGVTDTFTYAIADKNGEQDTARLSIRIEAEKQNLADAQRVTPGPDGVVQLPAGVSLSDVHVVGRDLVIDMPDGTHMVIVDGAVFVPQLVFGGVEVPSTNLAALLIDSEPQPAAGIPQSSGGNFAVPVGPLDPGVPLGNLIPPTVLTYSPPEFKEPGAFIIDHKPTIVFETPDQPVGAVNATSSVDEGALPARGLEPEGSHSASTAEGTTGTIVYTSLDGPNTITLNGVAITGVGQIFHGAYGDLTITSIANGAIGYNYVLLDNTSGDTTHDDFAVVIVDKDGDTGTATLTINIVDDVPTARNDADSLSEDATSTDGNVMTGSGTDSGATGADTQGADAAHVENSGTFQLTYGSLVINADGSYVYTLYTAENNPTAYAAVQALNNGQTLTDSYLYTLVDGDGDHSSATLTITINGATDNRPPSIGSGSVAVSEEGTSGGIPDGNGVPPSADTVDTNIAMGNLSLSDPNGDPLTVTLGLPTAAFTSHGVAVVWTLSPDGHTLTGAAGANPVITVTITNAGHYEVTLIDQIDHPNTAGEDALSFVVPVTASDGALSSGGSITVQVEDDMPKITGDVSAGATVSVDESNAVGGPVWAGPISSTSVGAIISAPVNYGADGPGVAPLYALVLNNSASGIQTALGNHPITLTIVGNTITGTYNDGTDHTAFTVAINAATGQVTLTQYVPLEHLVDGTDAAAFNDVLNLGDLLSASVTYHDYDGDSVTAIAPIGSHLQFFDDGPSIDVTITPIQESNNPYPVLQTGDDGTEGPGFTTDTSTANFGGVFGVTSDGGADGTAGVSGGFSFHVVSSASGLTSHDQAINLYLVGGQVVGSTAGVAPASATDASVVFSIAVDVMGNVTLTQYQQIDHPIADDPTASGAPFADQVSVLGSGLVELVSSASITDNDGDSASDSAALDLGGLIRFADDGPSLTSEPSVHSSVTLDETNGGEPVSSGAPIVVTSSDAIVSAGVNYGADGPGGATSYTISLTDGVLSLDSGLQTAQGDHEITLAQTNSTTITGVYNDGTDHTAFTVHINADGTLTVTQFTALEHLVDGSTAAAFDDALHLDNGGLGSLIDATATYSDFDGDTVTATVGIGDAITFLDDGPSVVPEASSSVHVDEDELPLGITDGDSVTTTASGSLAGLANFGGDGAGGFSFDLTGSSLPSTLTSGGAMIHYAVSGDGLTLIAYTGADSSANQVFTVEITNPSTGAYTVNLLAQIDHLPNDPANDDNQTLSIDLSTAIVATDADGDFVHLTSGVTLVVEDDIPTMVLNIEFDGSLTVDETVLGTDAVTNFSGAFIANFGADLQGADTSYALGISAVGADSGLIDTLTGQTVLLRMNGTTVEGYTSGSDQLVFTLSVNAAGDVTLDQIRAVVHTISSDPDTSEGATLASDSLITLTGTAHDGDTDSASAVLNIGQNLHFNDDGPSIVGTPVVGSSVTVDETDGSSPVSSGAPIVSVSAGAMVSAVVNYGADGPGVATAYGLTLSGNVVSLASGLQTALGDHPITLVQTDANTITGTYVDGGTQTAFTLDIGADGKVTVSLFTALEHLVDGSTAAAYDDALHLVVGENSLVNATATYTDGDGDTVTATAAIGNAITFLDDGPSIDVTKASDANLSLTTQDSGTIDPNSSVDATSANFGGLFAIGSSDGGGDGTASVSALSYMLGTTGGASGLTSHGAAINLYDVGGTIVGSTSGVAPLSLTDASVIFTVGTSATGVVTLTQYGPIDHASEAPGATDAPFNDQLSGLIDDAKITLTASATITDNDGDTNSDSETINIGSNLHFADDGPTVSLTLHEGGLLVVDETDGAVANAYETDPLGGNLGVATVPGSVLFDGTVNYGGDGAGSSVYSLSISADGVASGLFYSPTNASIVLHINGGVVEGHVGTIGGALAFTVSIDATTGATTLTQYLAVEHSNTASNNEASSALTAGVLSVNLTATDYDHDTAVAHADLGAIIRFLDDGPSIDISKGVDASVKLETFDSGTIGTASSIASSTADFSGVFGLTYAGGSDGAASVPTIGYSLTTTGGASGLFSHGVAINLYLISGVVVGSTSTTLLGVTTANSVFTVGVNGSGVVTLTQNESIDHPLAGDPTPGGAPYIDHILSLIDSAITLHASATVTDNDGDTATANQAVDIGANLFFHDDGPSASISVANLSVSLDESKGLQADSNDVAGPLAIFAGVTNIGVDADNGGAVIGYATSNSSVATDLVSSTGSTLGGDGAGAVTFSLTTVNGTDSGVNTTDGSDIFLYKEGNLIVGRVGSQAGSAAFAIAIDPATGAVSMVEYLSIQHNLDGLNRDDSVSLTASAISAVVTSTDSDGDYATATAQIGDKISFQDSAPIMTGASNINISNSGSVAFTGAFAYDLGADGPPTSNNVFKAISGTATVNGNAVTNYIIGETSETATSAVFAFSFDYPNGPGTTAHETGTLTFDKIAGTYTVDLANPIQGFSLSSTSGGTLFQGYALNSSATDNSQPAVAVTQVTPTLFVQFTSVAEPGSGTGANNLTTVNYSHDTTPPSDGSGLTFTNGELFSQAASWVSTSNTANGVAGDTIQGGEVLDFSLYNTNPTGFVGGVPTASADAMFIKLDGIGSGEDFIVVLKLFDTVTHQYTTQALIIQNSDIQKGPGTGPGAYSAVTLDNNDGLIVIESNDYNSATSHFVIVGAQIAGSDEGIVGTGINFNNAIGAAGASTGTQAFSTDVNDGPMKVSDIGFATTSTTAQVAHLTFTPTIQDGDGDAIQQTIIADVTSAANSSTPVALAPAVTSVVPVTLDTNHDGVISYLGTDAGVLYDMNHDGTLDHTAWVAPGDSILFRDADHNGTVSDATEFVFGGNGVTDMEALHAQYGAQLDASDADFTQFALWNDANSNGLVDAGEVQSLADAGITSIGLVSDGVAASFANGDVSVSGSSTYTYINDSGATVTGKADDAAFAVRSASAELEQRTALAANDAGVMAAAVAAMGLAAQHGVATADHTDSDGKSADTGPSASATHIVVTPDDAGDNHSLTQSESHVAANDDEGSAQTSPTFAATVETHDLDAVAQVSQPAAIAANDDSGPATDDAASMIDVAPAVVMAEVANSVTSGARGGVDPDAVQKIVAAAMDHGGDIDKLLAHLPAPVAQAAAQAFASHGGDAVPAWDSGHFGSFTAAAVPTIAVDAMMLHHDAAPAA